MKRYLIIILAVFLAIGMNKNPRLNYIQQYSGLAVSEMKRTGVPASIILAQGLIESNAGQSALALKGNNHFGVKCHDDWTGQKMFADDDQPNECFRLYPSVEASFKDHSDFIRYQDRYKSLFALASTDYKGWAKGLKKAGYATDPNYASKLIETIEDYELYKYDGGVKVEVPEPKVLESPEAIPAAELDKKYKEFVNISMTRTVFMQNGVPFIYSAEGETYRSIAEANRLFLGELLGFNDLKSDTPLETGTVVYLSRKKSVAAPGVNKYVTGADGETLYGISQRFGIRLACLQKLNIILLGKELKAGDTVRLR